MGLLAKLFSFERTTRNDAAVSDATVDPGGTAYVSGEHFAPIGDDSVPLAGDYAVLQRCRGTGRYAVVGYLDPANQQTASAGDKRTYARNADGEQVAEVWLKNDGTVVVSNDNGSVTLQPGGAVEAVNNNGYFQLQKAGTFEVNGVTIDTDGNIDTPSSITAPTGTITTLTSTSGTIGGVAMETHTHTQGPDSDGNTEQDTGAPQ